VDTDCCVPCAVSCCVLQVCLSLLGTWAGPSWEPGVSTLLQVWACKQLCAAWTRAHSLHIHVRGLEAAA
jgi:hypothetical protein